MLGVSLQFAEDIPLLVYLIFYIWLGIACRGVCAATSCCLLVGDLLLCCVRGCVVLGAQSCGSKNNIKTLSYSMEKYQKLPYLFFQY